MDPKEERTVHEEKPVVDEKDNLPGEEGKVSKNEQKRLAKLERLRVEKEEKDKKKAIELEEKKKAGLVKEVEEEVDPVLYYENRSKTINTLKSTPGKNPYPHKFHVSHTFDEFIKAFDAVIVEKGSFLDQKVSIAGFIS